jgi:hypothetical protein
LEVRPVTVPAGAMAQIRVELGAPLAVSVGSLRVELEGAVFGEIADVQMFSAAGELTGTVELDGRKAVVTFWSVAVGVGRIGGWPVMTVTVPVLETAAPGAKGRMKVEALDWRGMPGERFEVGEGLGTVTVGEAVVIESVTRVSMSGYKLTGRGFRPESRVTGEGMAVDRVTFRSGTELEVTVAGENELTGRMFWVDGSAFVYAPRGRASGKWRPLLPVRTVSSVGVFNVSPSQYGGGGMVLENPNPVAVDVTVEVFLGSLGFLRRKTTVLPALGRLEVSALIDFGFEVNGSGGLLFSLPIRAGHVNWQTKTVSRISDDYTAFRLPEQPFLIRQEGPLVFMKQVGGPEPGSQGVSFEPKLKTQEALPIVVTTTEKWLTAVARRDLRGRSLSVSVDPATLAAGDHFASVIITPTEPGYQPQIVPVRLEVRAAEFVRASRSEVRLTSVPGGPIPPPVTLTIRAGETVGVALTLRTETDDGGRWLTISAPTATSPASVEVRANPAGLKPGTYRGRIVVRGPINLEEVKVTFEVAPPVLPRLRLWGPDLLRFSYPVGGAQHPVDSLVEVSPESTQILSEVSTESGGGWLRVERTYNGLRVGANPSNLVAGIYRGKIIVRAAGFANELEVPVLMRVWSGETEPIVVTPSDLCWGNIPERSP